MPLGGLMKKLVSALPFLFLGGLSYAGTGGFTGLQVSSGTFQAISTYVNADGGNRQAVVFGDRISSATVPVDALNGMAVYLTTSSVVIPTSSTVSGTINAAQSGTWTVQPGNTANTTAWKVDGSAVTQPVSGTFFQTTQPISGAVSIFEPQVLGATVTYNGTQIVGIVQPTVLGATVTFNGTQNVQLQTGANAIGSITNTAFTANQGTAGVGWDIDLSTGVLSVQGNAGTSAWKVDFSTGLQVVGNVASGSTDSGNSVKIGGIGRTTYQTVVTDGQRADAQLDSEGKQVFMPYAVPALSTQGVTAAMTGTGEVVLISSGGSNINTYIDHILCTNSHATVGTVINIKNGTTVWYTGYAVAAGGGFSASLPTPLRGASNTQWTAVNATNGSNTYCSVVGYFAKN